MTRLLPLLCLGCVAAVAGTVYFQLGAATRDPLSGPPSTAAVRAAAADELARALHAARRSCEAAPLDAVVERARTTTTAPDAPAPARSWQLLAEALLERCLARTHLRGMVVGQPTTTTLPAATVADIDEGLAAAAKARQLGNEDADLPRVEAGLISLRITGLGSALKWSNQVLAALQQAATKDPDNPHLHVASGLRKLLSPRWLGHDDARALEHFEYAAKVLTDDERPAVFAAMACHLQQKRMQAIEWLERAVQRNPANKFAAVVLQRLRRGEADAFARDVTAAEAAAVR
ncbi:MAG: hypothetical protein JNN13_05195 [Planctomycetes bacterium]|nr:hypothetical protein [Planctomycetota bacterium]